MEKNERTRMIITSEVISELEQSTAKHNAVDQFLRENLREGPAIVDVQGHRGKVADYLFTQLLNRSMREDVQLASTEALYHIAARRFHHNIEGDHTGYRVKPNPQASVSYTRASK